MDKIFLKVSKISYGIQNEGEYIGVPMTFLHLAGNNSKEYYEMTEEEILRNVKRNPSKHVLITGDDDPLQQDLKLLIKTFTDNGYLIHLETSGLHYIPDGFAYVCISIKDEKESPKKERITCNLLKADSVKFMCGTPQWREIIEYYNPDICGTVIKYLQPIYGDEKSRQEAIEFVLQYPVFRLCLPIRSEK